MMRKPTLKANGLRRRSKAKVSSQSSFRLVKVLLLSAVIGLLPRGRTPAMRNDGIIAGLIPLVELAHRWSCPFCSVPRGRAFLFWESALSTLISVLCDGAKVAQRDHCGPHTRQFRLGFLREAPVFPVRSPAAL